MRRGILAHLREGRFSLEDYAVFHALLPLAAWDSGVWIGSGAVLFRWWGCPRKSVGDAMRRLRSRRYINYPDGVRRGDYPIVVIGHVRPDGSKVTWLDSERTLHEWRTKRTTAWTTENEGQESESEDVESCSETTERPRVDHAWTTGGQREDNRDDARNVRAPAHGTNDLDTDLDLDHTGPVADKPRRTAPAGEWKVRFDEVAAGLHPDVRSLIATCLPMWQQSTKPRWSWQRATEIAAQWAKLPSAQVAAGLRQFSAPRKGHGGDLPSHLSEGKGIGYAHAIVQASQPGGNGNGSTHRPQNGSGVPRSSSGTLAAPDGVLSDEDRADNAAAVARFGGSMDAGGDGELSLLPDEFAGDLGD